MTITIRDRKAPEPGDVFWADLDPVRGTEQAGRRPVVVLSDDRLHEVSLRSLVCPITSNREAWPTRILLPADCVVSGAILIDQARMIDRDERLLRYIGRLPEDVMALVLETMMMFVGDPRARNRR
jgi:mRNA interferase MazF